MTSPLHEYLSLQSATVAGDYTAVMCGLLRTLIRTSFWIQRLTGETIQLLQTKFGTQTGENVFCSDHFIRKKPLNAVESCD